MIIGRVIAIDIVESTVKPNDFNGKYNVITVEKLDRIEIQKSLDTLTFYVYSADSTLEDGIAFKAQIVENESILTMTLDHIITLNPSKLLNGWVHTYI